jgi:hypothetical protein
MPHGRPVQKGSFAGHFDELVAQFVAAEAPPPSITGSPARSQELQDRIDIHALLFERAWQLDDKR